MSDGERAASELFEAPGAGCRLAAVLEAVFAAAAGCLAVFTPLLHLALLAGWSFGTVAWIGLAALLASGLYALRGVIRALRAPGPRPVEPSTGATLAFAAAVAVAAALGFVRPDTDDAYYLPNAHHALAHPDEPLSTVTRTLADTGVAYRAFVTSTSYAIEYFWSVVSFWSGIGYLDVYYRILPAVASALAVGAWFLLLRRFARGSWSAAFGALAVTLGLLLMGDTHRCFGNFAYLRIWQGKTLFMALVLPLYAHASIGFLARPGAAAWARLACLATASVGLTLTSVFLLPLLTAVVLAGWLAARFDARVDARSPRAFVRPFVRTAAAHASALFYPVAVGLAVLRSSLESVGVDSFVNLNYPRDFGGNFDLVFGGVASFAFGLVVVSTVAALAVSRGQARRFLAGWLAAAVLLFLNPLVVPVYVNWITSPNAYWRLFYLLPFPLVLGVAAAQGGALARGALARAVLAGGTTAAALALAFVPGFPSALAGAEPRWAAYKLDPGQQAAAEEILRAAPDGPMLAAMPLSTVFPILTARVPQIAVRGQVVLAWGERFDDRAMATLRVEAWRFASGSGGSVEALARLLDRVSVPSIVPRRIVARRPDVRDLLERRGYERVLEANGYVLWVLRGER